MRIESEIKLPRLFSSGSCLHRARSFRSTENESTVHQRKQSAGDGRRLKRIVNFLKHRYESIKYFQ